MSDEQQPLNALPEGHRLQEYELVRVLGFGGFGMTYLGFDHNLDKAVAIKEYLPSDIATRTADQSVAPQASDFRGDFQWGLERFVDEARTLARFDHRHIIKVHRFFEAHGTAYIVMEYAEGETLSAFLERKGTLSEDELKGILYPLLNGLEVVHGADFLHRDIKPGNIVLRDSDGSPVLLDFGAARQAIGAKSRSVTSIVTPGYAPIEQYSSRGHQGAWTDIYALGGVCYRALTGDVPEDATDRVRHDPLVPVAQRCVGRASGAFLSAIDAALAVDEGDRPQSVGAWRAALGASVSVPARGQAQGESRRENREQAALEQQRRAQAALTLERKSGKVVSLPGGGSMDFVWLEPGVFQRGSPSSWLGRWWGEGPVHEVEISKGFWLGTYEVTQGQWESVMGTRPWSGKDYVREDWSHPAVYISWNDVHEFIGRLNEAAGDLLYRLPSEAEWEYACGAGSRTRWSFGDDASQLKDYAWYRDNAWGVGEKYAHGVGLKRPNPWGLYDMHGNIWEWVQDSHSRSYYNSSPRVDPPGPTSGSFRVFRGGGFLDFAQGVLSAVRSYFSPDARLSAIGVRLLRIRNP